MRIRRKILFATALGTFLCGASQALAETLPVDATYAAREDAPSRLGTIVVEPFDGEAGLRTEMAVRRQLEGAIVEGQPFFAIRRYNGEASSAQIEGTFGYLGGIAASDYERIPSGTVETTKCVKEDADGNCIKSKTYVHDCFELTVSMAFEALLVSEFDEPLYSRQLADEASLRYCTDDGARPSIAAIQDQMIERFASRVRFDLAPYEERGAIRVRESRSGMARAARREFKTALKLTKSDWRQACVVFDRLDRENPGHTTLLFNAGLCREAAGDLEAAAALYVKALEIEPGKDYPAAGLDRIASRRRAAEQLARRFAALASEPAVGTDDSRADAAFEGPASE